MCVSKCELGSSSLKGSMQKLLEILNFKSCSSTNYDLQGLAFRAGLGAELRIGPCRAGFKIGAQSSKSSCVTCITCHT